MAPWLDNTDKIVAILSGLYVLGNGVLSAVERYRKNKDKVKESEMSHPRKNRYRGMIPTSVGTVIFVSTMAFMYMQSAQTGESHEGGAGQKLSSEKDGIEDAGGTGTQSVKTGSSDVDAKPVKKKAIVVTPFINRASRKFPSEGILTDSFGHQEKQKTEALSWAAGEALRQYLAASDLIHNQYVVLNNLDFARVLGEVDMEKQGAFDSKGNKSVGMEKPDILVSGTITYAKVYKGGYQPGSTYYHTKVADVTLNITAYHYQSNKIIGQSITYDGHDKDQDKNEKALKSDKLLLTTAIERAISKAGADPKLLYKLKLIGD